MNHIRLNIYMNVIYMYTYRFLDDFDNRKPVLAKYKGDN